MYYAHPTPSEDRRERQRPSAPLREAGERAGRMASQFHAESWGRWAGLLHGAGKHSPEFQRRMQGLPLSTEHAAAMAQFVAKLWRSGDRPSTAAHILAYAVAGQQTELADYGMAGSEEGAQRRRLPKELYPNPDELERQLPSRWRKPPALPLRAGIHPGLQLSLFIRMLFSCLADADSLHEDRPGEPHASVGSDRSAAVALAGLLPLYRAYMEARFPPSEERMSRLRTELFRECLPRARERPGLFRLTLPTGSGKTLLSLGFALEHAAHHRHLRRIVFVAPHASAIESVAAAFREAVGAEHVLEHHANVPHDADEDEWEADAVRRLRKKREPAGDNWDAPIVVATNDEFFESLFSNRRSRCRKLHNIANSVIVLDEAQMMNGEFLKPCLHALEELFRNYGASVVLTTASRPPVEALLDQPAEIREIGNNVSFRFRQLRSVRLEFIGLAESDDIAGRMAAGPQALCVVNSRRAARELYEKLRKRCADDAGGVFHLSEGMCPKHRLKKLESIQERLKQGKSCRLVATPLIERGADVDFPVVYRELAGMDSIVQAAGRCNRERRMALGTTYVFETSTSTPHPEWFASTVDAARNALKQHRDDPLSPEALRAYFQELYVCRKRGRGRPGGRESGSPPTDKHDMIRMIEERAERGEYPFATVAETFKLLPETRKPVLIAYDDAAKQELERLPFAGEAMWTLRRLQPYVVLLETEEFDALLRAGELIESGERVFQFRNPGARYDEEIGVKPFGDVYRDSISW